MKINNYGCCHGRREWGALPCSKSPPSEIFIVFDTNFEEDFPYYIDPINIKKKKYFSKATQSRDTNSHSFVSKMN